LLIREKDEALLPNYAALAVRNRVALIDNNAFNVSQDVSTEELRPF
jgi:hypothetical protein